MTLGVLGADQLSDLNLPQGTEGLVVTGLDETGEAYDKGVRAGDVITEAGQQKVASIADLEAEEAQRKQRELEQQREKQQAEAAARDKARAEARAALTEALCLDAPLLTQYDDCFWDTVLDGSLGRTFDVSPQPVIELVAENFPATAELALAGMIVALCIALPLGLLAALRQATWVDHTATGFAMLGVAVPAFWLGPMLILAFTVHLDWLPSPARTDQPVAALVLPYSMQADVIDHDELLTGERREGLYGGLWSIAEKTAGGLGLGLSMLVLHWAGYQPNAEQSEQVLQVLRGLYVGVPCVCIAAGFVIALRYPLDREAHQEIAQKLRRG